MVVLWCKRRKSGKTSPFSPMFQPFCMQMCPLHIIREGKASKHAQSKLLIFYPFDLVFTWFLLEKHFGPLFRSYKAAWWRCRTLGNESMQPSASHCAVGVPWHKASLPPPPPHGGTARQSTKQGGTRRFRPPPLLPIPTSPNPTRNGPLETTTRECQSHTYGPNAFVFLSRAQKSFQYSSNGTK